MCCNLFSTERLGVAKNSYALKRVLEFQIELEFDLLGFYGKGSPKEVATVIVNSVFPQSYFITKMFVRHARILKHLLFCRMYQAIVSPYKFFDFHFLGTGQVSRKRNLCGNRRAETGLIQHCAGHRTSLQGKLQIIQPTFTAYKSGQYSSRHWGSENCHQKTRKEIYYDV